MDYYELCEKRGVILRGHFLLTSGRHSDIYGNKDAIYCDPKLYSKTIFELMNCIPPQTEALTAPAVAGIALAAPIALLQDRIFAYTEKKEGKMAIRSIYKKAIQGKRVTILEDAITTGGSVQKVIDSVIKAGGIIESIVCIWNRTGWRPIEVPIESLIDKIVESWLPEECPLCKQGLELQDPKK